MSEDRGDVRAWTELAVDQWRLIQMLARASDTLADGARARVHAQAKYYQGRLTGTLAGLGVNLVTYEGRVFDGSLPPTAQNADDFDGSGSLIVAETIEPTLMSSGQILHGGRVVLAQER